MFDAVWTAVLALNRTAARGYSLTEFNYLNKNLSDAIYNETLKVNFFGLTVSWIYVTGSVKALHVSIQFLTYF